MEYTTNLDAWLKRAIALVVLVSAVGLCFPVTSASFSPWYGSIAKNIALSNNWSDLILSNQDWLDKPHFPFWITAASFKLFGINSFAYVLPGFLFHLIGAYYTYKLAVYLYHNTTIGLCATLIYLTVLHLMLSAIDVRAEAYLLGQIMPAVYYWLKYDEKFSYKYLFLGAFFTGLALMTKGVFVIITIVSGLFCLWVYTRRWTNILHPKWLLALALSFVFAIPEMVALYLQFDLHPEKVIFGRTHVSGIRWFFIDSQFGRFFGTGPIVSTNPPPLHQLFFIHTFLWAFLPWCLVYPTAIYASLRQFKRDSAQNKSATVVLLGYFWVSFVMFSLTVFQVDHYTNIIFPFAAILSAKFLYDRATSNHKIFTVQFYLSILLLIITTGLIALLLKGTVLLIFVGLEIVLVIILIRNFGETPFIKALLFPTAAMSLLFVFVMTANGYLYHQYDAGYLAAQAIKNDPTVPVVDYQYDSRALEFFSHNPYYKVTDLAEAAKFPIFYAVMPEQVWLDNAAKYPQAHLVAQVRGNSSEKIIPHLGNPRELNANLATFDIVLFKQCSSCH